MLPPNKPYRVRQWQVLVRDAKCAADFYKACFGWTTNDRNSQGVSSIFIKDVFRIL
jgi:predicted enzyme related to lactoylglutathione lyase